MSEQRFTLPTLSQSLHAVKQGLVLFACQQRRSWWRCVGFPLSRPRLRRSEPLLPLATRLEAHEPNPEALQTRIGEAFT